MVVPIKIDDDGNLNVLCVKLNDSFMVNMAVARTVQVRRSLKQYDLVLRAK